MMVMMMLSLLYYSSATGADVPSAKLPSDVDSSRAVETFKNRLEALTSLLQHNLSSISTSLFAKSIISETEQQEAMKEIVIPKTRTVNLLNVVLSKIKYEPQVFVEVVKSIESEPSLWEQANELVHCYQGKYAFHMYLQPDVHHVHLNAYGWLYVYSHMQLGM